MRFTLHAVEQYIARCRTSFTYPEALTELQAHVSEAVRQRERTQAGDYLYLVPALNCRLVVKHERGSQIVVTVLEAEGELPTDLPTSHMSVEQLQRNSLHGLRVYLERRIKLGDRKASQILYDLRGSRILE